MAHDTQHKFIATPQPTRAIPGKQTFLGFAPPTSNTTFTPNQFFDVVLPNASRGCVRIVAYLIRKTLGWCDAHGNPQHEQIAVSNSELERRAGVGHDMIRAALNEGVAMHFIECVKAGRARTVGDAGETAVYSLKWDATPRYARTLAEFRGFYEGEGHRTDIPNQFFDELIPNETLAVVKVVGSVIRYSIGFVAKHGRRRQQATLAYTQILKVSGLSSRRTLASAIQEAIAKRYIIRLDAGFFSARISERRSATYALCWSDGYHLQSTVQNDDPEGITPKRIPASLWITPSEKDTRSPPSHSDLATSNAPIRLPAGHSEKDTIETKPLNERIKQQEAAAELLKKEGFDAMTATLLARKFESSMIHQQIQWLPQRNATKSRAGLLRRAIEENWPEPGKGLQHPAGQRHAAAPPSLPVEYIAWLREEHASYQKEAPDDYARFLAKRERRRADLSTERSAFIRRELLARHDSEITQLIDFQKFLALPDQHRWKQIVKQTNQPKP